MKDKKESGMRKFLFMLMVAATLISAFPLGIANASTPVVSTPSTIGSYTGGATNIGTIPHRNIYYVNGLWWVFGVGDATRSYYVTSVDGETWSAAQEMSGTFGAAGMNTVTYYDGAYFYYAIQHSGTLSFRRGVLNANTTITWSADEQLAASDIHSGYNLWSMAVDSNGRAFIVYCSTANNSSVVIRNANNDGTWSTDGSEFVLYNSSLQCGVIVPLSGGDMYVVESGPARQGFYYNGSWNSETIPFAVTGGTYSAVSYGDTVEFASDGGGNLMCSTRQPNGTWENTTIYVGGNFSLPPLVTLKGTSDLVITFTTEQTMYGNLSLNSAFYVTRDNGVWGNLTQFINESTAKMHDTDWDEASYQVQSNRLGMCYAIGAVGSSATALKFVSLDFDPERVFPDPALNASICTAIGIDYGDPIYQSQLNNLTSFIAESQGILDLEGMEYCTNLILLDLVDNSISDISLFSSLRNLQIITLDSNSISTISPLGNLTNLTEISLSFTNISNISPLLGLINLQALALGANNISDISILSGLINLAYLNLAINNISNISPLGNLTNLQTLILAWNSISNISPLEGIIGLETIHLENNSISNIVPLVANLGLATGDKVYLNNNPLSYKSAYTDIPILQARDVTVVFNAAPILGDINGDGGVNILDLMAIVTHFGETGSVGWIDSDLNSDGEINILDLMWCVMQFSLD